MLGYFTLALSAALLAPLLLALAEGDEGVIPLASAALGGVLTGGLMVGLFRDSDRDLNHREAIALVVLTWVDACLLGAVPFYLSDHFPTFADSFFESISGFTTTGATVLGNIEAVPRSLLLWRSLTHWLGGMGIILLGVAILPLVGTGGLELYRAEFSGSGSEKIFPRVAETATALWKIYALLTAAAFVSFLMAGMTPYDSICHTFSTLGTGGFSTRNASLESFANPWIELVAVIFMFLAGINFTMHYRLVMERKPGSFFRDREIRLFALVALTATLAITASLTVGLSVPTPEAVRQAAFQVVSILTTTGFSSANFELWTPFAQLTLLALMFIGGCTGSTAGGFKVSRIELLFLIVRREFLRMSEPRGVFAVHLSDQAVPEKTVQSLLNLVYLALLVNFGACLLLTAFGVDVLTAIAAVAASMFNIGPGLGEVGPADNYGHLPGTVKWVLSFCMLAGRLEFYVLIVIFTPAFWKR